MGNERDNSLLGRLYTKLRGCFLGGTLDSLVIGHHTLLADLKANQQIKAQLAAGIDAEQIECEFEARMMGRIALQGGEDSGSDSD